MIPPYIGVFRTSVDECTNKTSLISLFLLLFITLCITNLTVDYVQMEAESRNDEIV